MADSLFTKIIKREIETEIVYENDSVIAILDKYPATAGHTLVIPKNPSRDILESSSEELLAIMSVTQMVAKALMRLPGVLGITLRSNIREVGGQAIFHTHVHVIPRYDKNELSAWSHNTMAGEVEVLKNTGDLLRDILMAPIIYEDLHPDKPILRF